MADMCVVFLLFQDYLQQVRRELDCRAIKYIPLNKESHVLEVPDDSCRVPSSYSLVGHRKGFKRYSSGDLKELVATRQQKEEQREKVEAGCLQVCSPRRSAWVCVFAGGRLHVMADCGLQMTA